jgi:hypothetical protein
MATTAITAEQILGTLRDGNQRGFNLYHLTEAIGTSAIDRWGGIQQVTYRRPYFSLTLQERVDMARYSAMVYGIIGSRMNRIGSLNWNVESLTDRVDRQAEYFDNLAAIYDEWADVQEPGALVMRRMIVAKLKRELPDLRPDMKNFKSALMRYVKKCKRDASDSASEVEDWLIEPNPDYSFEEFLKLWVWDLHVHGAFSMYKEIMNGRVENIYGLPGGTVVPVANRYVGGATAYLQIVPAEVTPQIMFNDELCFSRWLPTSAGSYGLVPLEALVNKVAEQLMFDEQAAIQADGTKPPEKVVVFGEQAPFGDLDASLEVPIEKEEQKKIETVLNEKRKNAIRTLSGVGQPVILDLSKADLFQNQADRQRQLKEDVGLVFGASNMEMNLSGSEDTSGRATSESEERIEQKRGVAPILRIIEEKLNRDVIPFRFGPGYRFQFASGLSEFEEIKLVSEKLKSGAWSVNEVRIDNSMDPYPEEIYDRPPAQQSPEDNLQPGGGNTESVF